MVIMRNNNIKEIIRGPRKAKEEEEDTKLYIYIDMGSTFRQINDSDLLSGLRVVLDKDRVKEK